MKILFYRYNSICEPDILEAFEALGYRVAEEASEISDKQITPSMMLDNVSQILYHETFDCLFSVNFYPVLAEVCNIFHLPYLCWTVDSPVLELYSESLRHPWNRIFLFDHAQYEDFAPLNPSCIFYLPLATNTARWNRTLSDPKNLNQQNFHHKISFVGSLYTEKSPYDSIQHLPPYLKGYLEGLMSMQEQIYGDYLIERLLTPEDVRQFKACFPSFYHFPEKSRKDDRAVLAQLYLGNKITSNERLHLLKLLGSSYPVDLYTGSPAPALPVNRHGTVSTHEEMPFIFRNSCINLNTTVRGIRTGIPLRIWDILGCGGFLLTNYQAEIPEYFTIGEDLDIFTCAEELLEKADYYLHHEIQRKEIARSGHEKVLAAHSYLQRIQDMFQMAFPK